MSSSSQFELKILFSFNHVCLFLLHSAEWCAGYSLTSLILLARLHRSIYPPRTFYLILQTIYLLCSSRINAEPGAQMDEWTLLSCIFAIHVLEVILVRRVLIKFVHVSIYVFKLCCRMHILM